MTWWFKSCSLTAMNTTTTQDRDYRHGFADAAAGRRPVQNATPAYWAGYEDGSMELAA